jgi:hypothetical protein
MSYILEALKKSDKKRQQEESVSLLDRVPPTPPGFHRSRPERRHSFLPATLIAVLVAGLFSWYLLGDGDGTDTGENPAVEESDKGIAQPVETPMAMTDQGLPLLQATKKKHYADKVAAPPREGPESLTGPDASPVTIPYLQQLSPSFRETVPEFKLAGHVFSPEPQLRLVMINNKIVREKDTIEKGIILEEITRDGVILRSGGERFQLRVD